MLILRESQSVNGNLREEDGVGGSVETYGRFALLDELLEHLRHVLSNHLNRKLLEDMSQERHEAVPRMTQSCSGC